MYLYDVLMHLKLSCDVISRRSTWLSRRQDAAQEEQLQIQVSPRQQEKNWYACSVLLLGEAEGCELAIRRMHRIKFFSTEYGVLSAKKKKKKRNRNMQQLGFAGGHPPNY